MKNLLNFISTYRSAIMGILISLIAMLAIVSLQAVQNIPLGFAILAIAVVAALFLDYSFPKKPEATARSLNYEKDVSTSRTLSIAIYAGSFLAGLFIFTLSGEKPSDQLLIGPWGSVSLGVTILGPVLFHLYVYLRKKNN